MSEPIPLPPPVPPAGSGPDLVRAGRVVLAAGLAAMVLAVVVFPVGFAVGLGAVLAGRRTLRAARRAGRPAPGMVAAGITFGAVAMLLAALVTAVLVWLWPEVSAYQDCMAGANTELARTACEDALLDSLGERLGG
ncbi:MAG: hypothetical protein MUC45_00075 [Actinomycetia bacterium]|nr:hypothetical protein [Actinomycetes bacterium]